jgi:hypothetical protein
MSYQHELDQDSFPCEVDHLTAGFDWITAALPLLPVVDSLVLAGLRKL